MRPAPRTPLRVPALTALLALLLGALTLLDGPVDTARPAPPTALLALTAHSAPSAGEGPAGASGPASDPSAVDGGARSSTARPGHSAGESRAVPHAAVPHTDEPCAGVRAARAAVRQEAHRDRSAPHGPLAVAVPGTEAVPPGGEPDGGPRPAAPSRPDRTAADRGRAPPPAAARA
ncbi:hypothetical protein ABZ478_12430 [Streptomyces sp. NPDC005706]|uniref:hypothetical protein n=1 Tax=Streptomyces sp. NPDC005706 TaxID=3157169 RepID=UPI0034118E4F